jgi:hypothetical protein
MRLRLAIAGLLIISASPWAQEPTPGLEAEFVASDVFRSGSLVVRTWKDPHLDRQYIALLVTATEGAWSEG